MEFNFYGIHSNSLQTNSFLVSSTKHANGLISPAHSHSYGVIHYVTSGIYEEQIGDTQFEVEERQLLYKPPNLQHANSFQLGGSQTYRIEFSDALLERLPLPTKPLQMRRTLITDLFHRIGTELIRSDDLSKVAVESAVWGILCEIIRSDREVDDRTESKQMVLEVVEILRSNLRQPPTVATLAEKLRIHPSQLSRVFKKYTGVTISGFLKRHRVEVSMELLSQTDLSLATIAIECGFSDQSHFSRNFREITSTSPSQWRSVQ